MIKIFGAGLAGLLAGCHFQRAHIFEANDENAQTHKAVLRFRTPDVGDAIGIDFKKVRVHKGIWFDGKFVQPNIQLANWYSQKVIGKLADRSIWNLEPVDRWIAPEDLIPQLIERCAGRINWNTSVTEDDLTNAATCDIISTLPMSLMAKWVAHNPPSFSYAPIHVKRWRIPNADVYQTIYFPDPAMSLYRASITGDLLIAEYAEQSVLPSEELAVNWFNAFGFGVNDLVAIDGTSQRFGKIAPIDDVWRKQFMFDLSLRYRIFSLGRFAIWRNILLDDVLHDIAVVKKLMNTSTYEQSKIFSK